MRALISVSATCGIVEFALGLEDLVFEILSTGGTYKTLKDSGVKVIEVSEFTASPEMFEGRIKTLHPKIHGGILYKRDNLTHMEQAQKYDIKNIDLVCVNLYPFKETTIRTDDFEEIIENIDIGGPTMVRSAAKNFKDVFYITYINEYNMVLNALKDGDDSYEFRRDLMIKAYEHTASYDSMIANYMNDRFNGGFGAKRFITGSKVFDTRYGENPHQKGAAYEFDSFLSLNFTQLKGEASFNNMTDINSAVAIASAFGDAPAVAICKHANPCGFAIGDNELDSYIKALKCDPVSAFGGVVAINGTLTKELAIKTKEIFIEVIIAANIEDGVLEIYSDKKRTKIFTQNNKFLVTSGNKWDFKHIDGGFVFQEKDSISDTEVDNAKQVTIKTANPSEIKDLKIAWKIAALTKSNCVVCQR